MKLNILLLSIVFLGLVLTGCSTSNSIEPETIMLKSIEANEEITTYAFDHEQTISMMFTIEEKETTITSKNTIEGIIDKPKKQFDILSITTTVLEPEQPVNITMRTIMYENILYINSEGSWMKQPFEQTEWAEIDFTDNIHSTLTKLSNTTNLDVETSTNTYIITTENSELVSTMLTESIEGAIDLFLITESKLQLHINKKRFNIEKVDIDITFSDGNQEEYSTNTITSSIAFDYQTQQEITLPSEAENAFDLSEYMQY